jgi:carbamate kinase
MGPKVHAACAFARNTGNDAVIGSLAQITDLVEGTGGTRVGTRQSVPGFVRPSR